MATVHVFASTGRFNSLLEMRTYIDECYTDDGEAIRADFMREVGLSEYEPGCIEAIVSACGEPVPLRELLQKASYAEQWLHRIDGGRTADSVLCVYDPNVLATPAAATIEYLGEFAYAV
jgi:hypothetical protein